MSKKIEFKFNEKNIDGELRNIIQITENAQANDYILLSEIFAKIPEKSLEVATNSKGIKMRDYVKSVVNSKETSLETIEDAYKGLQNVRNSEEFKELNKNYNELQEKYKNLEILSATTRVELTASKNEITNKQKSIEEQARNYELTVQNKINEAVQQYRESYTKKINELTNEIASLRSQKETIVDITKAEVELSKNQEILKLTEKFQNIEREKNILESSIKNIKLEIQNKHLEEKHKLDTQHAEIIKDLEAQIEVHKRMRKFDSTKALGENLELEMESKMTEFFLDDQSVIMDKANEVINGSKPDYTFVVKDGDLVLTNVVLEMKTQDINTTKGKKNSEYFEKLSKDQSNYKAQYSILVSELEPDIDFSIKVAGRKYKNMFVVRPAYLVSFLNVIKTIAEKYKDISRNTQRKAIEFESRINILNRWNEFKEGLLNSTIKNINKNYDDLIPLADAIASNANKIKEKARLAFDTHFGRLVKALENFKIDKEIISPIDNLDLIEEIQEDKA